jgi:uncharacterized membrane protein YedE/YeeE
MIGNVISTFVSFSGPWPWYVAGPVIGLFVPALLIVDNKVFGVSSSLRHLCSAVLPSKLDYFRYDWKRTGLWNLFFVVGILVGGFLASHWGGSQNIAISEQTRIALTKLSIHDLRGLRCSHSKDLSRWSWAEYWSGSGPPMPEVALPVTPSPALLTCSYRH